MPPLPSAQSNAKPTSAGLISDSIEAARQLKSKQLLGSAESQERGGQNHVIRMIGSSTAAILLVRSIE
jgi:hypothetical protein